jgi:hypothetical protein
MSRGCDSATLQELFRDNLKKIYGRLFNFDDDDLVVPKDYYTTIAEATETA